MLLSLLELLIFIKVHPTNIVFYIVIICLNKRPMGQNAHLKNNVQLRTQRLTIFSTPTSKLVYSVINWTFSLSEIQCRVEIVKTCNPIWFRVLYPRPHLNNNKIFIWLGTSSSRHYEVSVRCSSIYCLRATDWFSGSKRNKYNCYKIFDYSFYWFYHWLYLVLILNSSDSVIKEQR